jgi:hypothetical protein
MSESDFRRWITKNKPKNSIIQTIETGTGSGVPDLFYCWNGRPCWIELKATQGRACYMRISQWRWFCNLAKAKGVGFLIIKRLKQKEIDIYDIKDLTTPEMAKKGKLVGQNIIFPEEIKPLTKVDIVSGHEYFYHILHLLLRRERNKSK